MVSDFIATRSVVCSLQGWNEKATYDKACNDIRSFVRNEKLTGVGEVENSQVKINPDN